MCVDTGKMNGKARVLSRVVKWSHLVVYWIGPVGLAVQIADKLPDVFQKLLKICRHDVAISVLSLKHERGWSADVHLH